MLRVDQAERIQTLTDEQANTILAYHKLSSTDPVRTLLELAATRRLDQRKLLLPLFKTTNPIEIKALETVVGKQITYIRRAIQHAPTPRPGRPRPPKPDDNRVITNIVPNPKKINSASYDRYSRYREGMTVTEALAAGITSGDLKWDEGRGFITIA